MDRGFMPVIVFLICLGPYAGQIAAILTWAAQGGVPAPMATYG